jgi:hypothetical protein
VRGHHRAEPHRPAADHCHEVARAHICLAHGVIARREDVAHEQHVLVARGRPVPLGNLAQREVGLRHAHVLRLGTRQVTHHHPHPEDAEHHALHELAAAAEPAVAACDEERPNRPLPLLELGHAVALGLDRADVLVAEHEPLLHLEPAVVGMQVRAADRGVVDAQEDVVRLFDLRARDLLDAHVLGSVEDDCLHTGHRPRR